VIDHIEAKFAHPMGRVLAESIFGHTDAARVRDGVVDFCTVELDARPAELHFFTMSVGAVFGVRLADGRDVVVKVHLPRERLDRLACVQRVQRHLAAHWSVKHFRFRWPEVRTIYDWDSLCLDSEPSLVAGAAVHFPYTEVFDVPRVASLDEVRAFVAEYERERAAPFTPDEGRAVAAAAVHALAYTARFEHALDSAGDRPKGSYREALASFGEELLA
jgi:hypothetical protein